MYILRDNLGRFSLSAFTKRGFYFSYQCLQGAFVSTENMTEVDKAAAYIRNLTYHFTLSFREDAFLDVTHLGFKVIKFAVKR